MFKSKEQPFCRWCGKPIKKWTVSVYVKPAPTQYDHPHPGIRYVYVGDQPPRTKQDCQRLTNCTVVSVQRSQPMKSTIDGYVKDGEDHISRFTEWDGETYDDQFFCSGEHARNFGYSIASTTTFATEAYRNAKKGKAA